MRIELLGVLALHVDGRPVDVPGNRRRTVLAVLALAAGRVVTTERLVDLLWPDQPPADALRALYNHVSRVRKHLGPAGDRLTTHEAGYALRLGPGELDVVQARRLADQVDGRSAPAVIVCTREALSLWRGASLEEFRAHHDLAASAIALDELRARLRDDLTAARLQIGDRSVVADARVAAAEQPLRERTALLLVQALAEDGRPAEAMAEAAAFRGRLADETGLDPGPGLAALEQRVAAGQVSSPDVARLQPPRLARPTAPLVGRERDREEVFRLLGEHRVVTLTGTGGVGKTRLALEVAADIVDRGISEAVFVDLATVDDVARVGQAVLSTLRPRTSEAAGATAADVAATLADARLLLVLDNCEHVVVAARELVDAVAAQAEGVTILSTSRVVLNSRSEHVLRLQPLPVPAETLSASLVEEQACVRAFLAHARRRDQGFVLRSDDVAPLVSLLRTLDGLPLAIEIAAGHAVSMPIATLRDRLALDLVDSGSADDARQATLRATILWSYARLGPAEQSLLRAIALFPGGVDLDTLEHLTAEVTPGGDPWALLRRLVDASLLDVGRDRSRYSLLFTVRSFLIDELRERGEAEAAERRFVRRMVRTASELGIGLRGPDEASADRRLRAELANLRAARDLARDHGDHDALVDITLHLDRPAIWRDIRELWAWCLELVDDAILTAHPRATEILGAAAEAARLSGDYETSIDLARQGLARGGTSIVERARCESALAAVALYRGEFTEAAHGWLRAVAGEPDYEEAYLASAALAWVYAGDPVAAREILDRAIASARRTACRANHAFGMYVTGELTALTDPIAAMASYRAAITEAETVGASFVAGVASVSLAAARTAAGETASAARTFADLLEIWHTTGQAPQLWTTARNAADLLLVEGRAREAILLVTHADRAPDAAAVADPSGPSTSVQLPAAEVGEGQRREFEREAMAMSVADVVRAARQALLELAGTRADDAAGAPAPRDWR